MGADRGKHRGQKTALGAHEFNEVTHRGEEKKRLSKKKLRETARAGPARERDEMTIAAQILTNKSHLASFMPGQYSGIGQKEKERAVQKLSATFTTTQENRAG